MFSGLVLTLHDILAWNDSFQTTAFFVVFLAGLSQAIAQSIILFVNQVKPLRFAISLLLAAGLFVVGYLFWALSIWLTSRWLLAAPIPFEIVTRSLTMGYFPLLLSFLGALPYLGVPILRLLFVWSLLLVVSGFEALAQLPATLALAHVGLGWVVMLVIQQTVGQPLVNLGQWLTNKVAGVTLVVDQQQLKTLINQRPIVELGVTPTSPSPGSATAYATAPAVSGTSPSSPTPPVRRLSPRRLPTRRLRKGLRLLLIYGGIALLAVITAISLEPMRERLLLWIGPLNNTRLPTGPLFDLLWMGSLALVVAGLLAPLEALGWWAGWYGDPVQTLPAAGGDAAQEAIAHPVRRYIIYLDGINQSTRDYQPAVAQYLNDLEAQLPPGIILLKGIMPYSVLNRSLTQGRPLAFFWRWTKVLSQRLAGWVGILINLRNLLIVAVSADRRYGPIYNQGVAQRVYESLVQAGYPVMGGVPLTLIGYSGGGQIAMGIMPFLRQALVAPIEVISLAGVISGNVRALEAEQLYHLAGDRDRVAQLGAIMFPRRWPLARLSYWNRAKRQGNISLISLGPVGHQVPGGVVDPNAFLPDGRSHLQQTIDITLEILVGDLRQLLDDQRTEVAQTGNYYRFQAEPINQPDYFPLAQALPAPWYQPVGHWVGRLILPEPAERSQINGVWFEVRHAPADYGYWVGQRVQLCWQPPDNMWRDFQAVTRDIHFSADAEASHREGLILPTRLNHWRLVTPLESLAGARPVDDVIVQLPDPVEVRDRDRRLVITHEPIQTTGLYYGLVQILTPVDETLERYRVVHFNPTTQAFDGLTEVVRLPTVVPDSEDISPTTNRDLEKSPLNEAGWYIYGVQDAQGEFVVQSLRPRCLFQLRPSRFINRDRQGRRYLQHESWADLAAKKNTVESVLIAPQCRDEQAALAQWREGDQALVVHVYGGIGGEKRESAARGPVYFGHFAYGIATVMREPIANELQFQIRYHQVYTHNRRGLIAGTLDWSLYMGDRQNGFLGTRPVSDILVKLPAYTEPFKFSRDAWSALDDLRLELEMMTARYRTGDGNGVTYVGPANNCAQDSNQAMYASAKHLEIAIQAHRASLQAWEANHPDQATQFQQLLHFRKAIQHRLLPLGSARADWDEDRETLGSNLSDYPLKTLGRGLLSWRTMLPRKASDTITELCLEHGAMLWVLRTNQVGGYDPDIEPLAPLTL